MNNPDAFTIFCQEIAEKIYDQKDRIDQESLYAGQVQQSGETVKGEWCLQVSEILKNELCAFKWVENPEYLKDLEEELNRTQSHRDEWLWAYSLVLGVLKRNPGWETAKEFGSFPDGIRELEAVKLAKRPFLEIP